MSGGHFDHQDYQLHRIADDIQGAIDNNDLEGTDGWGSARGNGFSPATIIKFREAIVVLEVASTMAHRIDWLLSGDDGEDNFHTRWDNDLASHR